MKVYITKYALSTGRISEQTGQISPKVPTIFKCDDMWISIAKPHWHEKKEDAIEQAEKMRMKKIASLEKQIKQLREMKFE